MIRNWLSLENVLQVKQLMGVALVDVPVRVRRANWFIQQAAFQYFFDVRLQFVISAIDALTHVRNAPPPVKGQRISMQQRFATSSSKLALLVNREFTRDEAWEAYSHRSDFAHGDDPWAALRNVLPGQTNDPKEEIEVDQSISVVESTLRLERIVRDTIVKSLVDGDFANIFSDDAQVLANFHSSSSPSVES